MDNWRILPITEKQINKIIEIQNQSEISLPPFKGGTRGEASDYIEEYGKPKIEIFEIPKR